ncbi:MAG TPA: DRTGG domain-containing protein [Thermodesulfovibrionales bacterium]|nr:DRTGG domain-containing protein [Thermodesulfovibrionales bacterium]
MKVNEMAAKLSLRVNTTKGDLGREVTGCYISDLLSDVMANAKEGEVWITLQTHPNIVAVAALKNLSGIIITNNRIPEEETLKKAEAEGMPIMLSASPTFETGGSLYRLLRC